MSTMRTMSAVSITEEQLAALVARHVESQLPPEKMEEIAAAHIRTRIGQLSLPQAAQHLGCRNVRQLTDFCREHGIPIEYFSAKKRFVRIEEIEAAQKRNAVRVGPAKGERTVVRRVVPIEERSAA